MNTLLTTTEDYEIIINVDMIISMEELRNENETKILMANNQVYYVKERFENLKEMFHERG